MDQTIGDSPPTAWQFHPRSLVYSRERLTLPGMSKDLLIPFGRKGPSVVYSVAAVGLIRFVARVVT